MKTKKIISFLLSTAILLTTLSANLITFANQANTSVLSGKTVLCVGDSITYGFCDNPVGGGWAKRLQDNYGMIATNKGKPANSLSDIRYYTALDNRLHINCFKDVQGNKYDYVILHGGINDMIGTEQGFGVPVGVVPPIGQIAQTKNLADFDTSTFAGGLERYFYLATQYYPEARFGFIINYKTPNFYFSGMNQSPDAYWDIAKQICDKWQIPYLDLYSGKTSAGLSYSEDILKVSTGTCIADGIHLSANGYDTITPYIAEWMTTLYKNTEKPNVIGNNCSNVSFSDPKNVSYEPGVQGNVLVAQQPTGSAPYGPALAVTPLTTTGGNGQFEVFIDPTGANMSSIKGIAFYVKVPNVSVQTAIEVRLIATNNSYWFNLKEGAPIYYLQTGATQVETVNFSDSNYTYPVNNKSGWDGFVFIPFDSYVTQSGDRAKFEAAPAGELRLRINLTHGNNSALTNQKFIFDEFGLYSDIEDYVALATILDGDDYLPSSVTSQQYTVSGDTLRKIPLGTSIDSLLAGINEKKYCKVYKNLTNVVGTTLTGTGMTLKITDGTTVTATYTIVVTGDTNGDGKTTVTDMIAIKAHILSKTDLEGASLTAADTSGDSKVTITDFIQVKAKILNKGNITAR